MSDLQIFNNPEFGQVRMVEINGIPYAVGIDVARALGYAKPTDAVTMHCRASITYGVTDSLGRIQETKLIPEGDIYRLIVKAADQSKNPDIKEKAERFEKWIFDEVIPSIRKHGAYLTPEKIEEVLLNPDAIIKLAMQLKEERQKRLEAEKTIQIMKPKAEFFDAVAGSKDAIDMNRAAKLIYEETRLGRNKLFKLLRDKGILMKDNIPYQEYIDKGYFRTIEQKYTKPDGTTHIYIKTLVYQKGLEFIRKIVKEDNVIHLKRA